MTTQHGSNLTGALEQNGGTTRIVYGQPTPEVGSLGAHRGEPNKIVGETQRTGRNPNGSQESSSGFARFDVGTQTHSAGDTIMSTLRSGGSQGATVELEPGNPASRTSLAVAKRMGVITDGNSYRDTSPGKDSGAEVPQTTPEASEDESDPAFDQWLADKPARDAAHKASMDELAAEHAAWDLNEYAAFESDIADLPQVAYDTTVSAVVAACLDGGSLSDATDRLARGTGMEPARAAQYVEHSFGMYRDTVLRAVIPDGIRNPEAFFTWCRSQRGLQDAISTLTVQRDVSKFKAMAREYSAYQARHSNVNG